MWADAHGFELESEPESEPEPEPEPEPETPTPTDTNTSQGVNDSTQKDNNYWITNEDGSNSYVENNKKVKGAQNIDGKKLFFNNEGVQLKGAWIKNEDGSYSYYDQDTGEIAIGKKVIDNNEVFFDNNGKQIKGEWVQSSTGNYSYYEESLGHLLLTDTTPTTVVANKVSTDKAIYNPNETVKFSVSLSNPNKTNSKSQININIYHLNEYIGTINGESVTMSPYSNQVKEFYWTAPGNDFQGYRGEVTVDGKVEKTIAIDVSSTWTKFPRYGSLTTFTKYDINSNKTELEQMKDNYVNSIEYYDAYHTPQEVFPVNNELGEYTQPWAPWNNDYPKSGQVVKDAVDRAHELGMSSMLYNMIYAFTGDATNSEFIKSIGVKPEWLLYHAEGDNKDQLFTNNIAPFMGENYKDATQNYLDITNPEVQQWIYDRMAPALSKMNFDGWHGDTIGDNGLMYTKNADGTINHTLRVGDHFPEFIKSIKEKLGDKKFAVNTVGQYGQSAVAHTNSDLQYSETWWGDYNMIANIIKDTSNVKGQSLVLPAYVQKNERDQVGKEFNPNTTLILDAVAYAAGGGRVEIVDGDHLLDSEYFPSKNHYMSDDLKERFHNYQTFITAYENLLRDGQKDNHNIIDLYDYKGTAISKSSDAQANTIYTYSRSSDTSETIQLINLMGVTDLDWKGNSGQQVKPIEQKDFYVQYHPSAERSIGGSLETKHVYIESPDGDNANKSIELPFKWVTNQYGTYLDIKVPSLEYWDMIHITN